MRPMSLHLKKRSQLLLDEKVQEMDKTNCYNRDINDSLKELRIKIKRGQIRELKGLSGEKTVAQIIKWMDEMRDRENPKWCETCKYFEDHEWGMCCELLDDHYGLTQPYTNLIKRVGCKSYIKR